jgi:hypothetical protein
MQKNASSEAEMHSFSYTNDQVLYNQFSPYFLCRVSWLPIITNLDSLSQIRLNEYQLKSISFNYNICGIWKIFNNTRQRKCRLNKCTGFPHNYLGEGRGTKPAMHIQSKLLTIALLGVYNSTNIYIICLYMFNDNKVIKLYCK